MNKASEIIEQIDRELSFIELGIHFPITGKYIKEKLNKLKELTEWTAFDKDNPPQEDKICVVKSSYYGEDTIIDEFEDWEYFTAEYNSSLGQWVSETPIEESNDPAGTFYKELE